MFNLDDFFYNVLDKITFVPTKVYKAFQFIYAHSFYFLYTSYYLFWKKKEKEEVEWEKRKMKKKIRI